jgi:hypothetical protein
MNDERNIDIEQTPNEDAADADGKREAAEIAGGDEPGVTDYLKAAKDGAKNLKNLEP